MGWQSARAGVHGVSPNFLTPVAFPKLVSACYTSHVFVVLCLRVCAHGDSLRVGKQ